MAALLACLLLVLLPAVPHLLWDAGVISSPSAVAFDSKCVFVPMDGHIWAREAATARPIWKSESLAIDRMVHSYVIDNLLVVESAEGALVWLERGSGRVIQSMRMAARSLALVGDRTLLVGVYDDGADTVNDYEVRAIDAVTGGIRWKWRLPSLGTPAVALDKDGIYVQHRLVAGNGYVQIQSFRREDGKLRWTKLFSNDENFSGLVVHSGVVLAVGFESVAMRARDGQELWRLASQEHGLALAWLTPAPAVIESMLLFGRGGTNLIDSVDIHTGRFKRRWSLPVKLDSHERMRIATTGSSITAWIDKPPLVIVWVDNREIDVDTSVAAGGISWVVENTLVTLVPTSAERKSFRLRGYSFAQSRQPR
jgi:outer membrane protein assembly factor BamB